MSLNRITNAIATIPPIKQILKRLQEPPKVLGRWGLELSDQQIIRRIERANEDHCGPCGLHLIKKENKL